MKLLNYTLAAVLGASVGSWATYRVVSRSPVEAAPTSAPRATAPAQISSVPDPAAAAERERLMKENAKLKEQLESASASLVAHDATLKQAAEQLEELRRPMVADILSSTLRAELKSGEVVVTGGYKLPDGRRLYAFAKPVIQDVNGSKAVKIEGRYLTVTDEVGKSVGLDNLATNAANTLQHGEVWVPGEEDAVLSKLQATPGTEVLSYPGISMRPGQSGTISVGGIQLKISPTLAESGEGLGLELRLEQPQQNGDAAK